MNPPKPLHILLVDDHRVVRAGVRAILEEHGRFRVAGEAGTVGEAIRLAEELHPDMVLVDMRLPDESGSVLCRRIKELDPGIKVVILTSFAEQMLVFGALAAGADGYLLKDCHDDVLLHSLSIIASGSQVLAPAVLGIVSGSHPRDARRNPFEEFTERELGILRLMTEGCTYKEVASRLLLAEKTVRNVVSQMIDKAQVLSRNALIAQFARSEPGPK